MDAYLQRRSLDFDFNAIGDFEDKFLGIVNADAVADELASSIAWVMENVSKTPVGAACPLRKTTEIKELLEKGTQGVLSAGSLSALSLPATALDRGGHVIEREPVCYACGALAQPSPLWRTADRGRFSWWPPRTSSADDGDAADLLLVEVREGDIVTELGYRPGHTYPARIVHPLTSELMMAKAAAAEVARRTSAASPKNKARDLARASWRDLTNKIAESTQLKPKKVRQVFAALRTIAYAEVKRTKKFVIPKLLTLELKHKPARKAGTKVMFGREVKVAAKPASKVVRALPAKALKDSI